MFKKLTKKIGIAGAVRVLRGLYGDDLGLVVAFRKSDYFTIPGVLLGE